MGTSESEEAKDKAMKLELEVTNVKKMLKDKPKDEALMKKKLRDLEEAVLAALDCGTEAVQGSVAKELKLLKAEAALYDEKLFRTEDHPSVMDPLIMGAMLNDFPRLAWMVFKVCQSWKCVV